MHRYPDRVLFLTTGTCSTYCRYCTRARAVGNPGGEYQFSPKQWEKALAYLEAHTEVRDVLLSGGDPLSIGDERLDWLLGRLRAIKHIEFLRIGTKIPMVLPQRITKALVKMLKKHHPLFMSLHVTHPREFTDEVARGDWRGWPMPASRSGSQTVLMKGINDDIAVMKPLMHAPAEEPGQAVLPLSMRSDPRLRPFPHQRVDKGLEIIEGLRGHTTGYATPIFAVDAPGGGGKIQIAPDFVVGRDGDDLLLRNFEGKRLPLSRSRRHPGQRQAHSSNHLKEPIMRIGVTYDLRSDYLAMGYSEEDTAEFDSEVTIACDLRRADVTGLAGRPDRQRQAAGRGPGGGRRWDAVFNFCEGLKRTGPRGAGAGAARGLRYPLCFLRSR